MKTVALRARSVIELERQCDSEKKLRTYEGRCHDDG